MVVHGGDGPLRGHASDAPGVLPQVLGVQPGKVVPGPAVGGPNESGQPVLVQGNL